VVEVVETAVCVAVGVAAKVVVAVGFTTPVNLPCALNCRLGAEEVGPEYKTVLPCFIVVVGVVTVTVPTLPKGPEPVGPLCQIV
jgi:hypothetical protein